MQTFLPYPSFSRSAGALDDRRLGKQRIEAKTILKALRGKTRGWRNHPAVRMWKGYEPALRCYHNAVVIEWRRRGFKDSSRLLPCSPGAGNPPWFGSRLFHDSHKSNLLRKDPVVYSRFRWKVPKNLPYVWPV